VGVVSGLSGTFIGNRGSSYRPRSDVKKLPQTWDTTRESLSVPGAPPPLTRGDLRVQAAADKQAEADRHEYDKQRRAKEAIADVVNEVLLKQARALATPAAIVLLALVISVIVASRR